MKKLSYMFFVSIFFLSTMVLLSSWTFAQPISLEGTWESRATIFDLNDNKISTLKNMIGSICQYPEISDYVPSLFIYDPVDPFFGFIRGDIVTLFKQNQHEQPNLGLEIIIAKLNKKGNRMDGTGTGFDSNMDWGSSWSTLMFMAEKISDTPQIICPSKNPWFCFYPGTPEHPCDWITFR